MGNYTSRLDGQGDAAAEREEAGAVRCHYEILGAPQTATPDELKRAYRQQALLHHPDKNPTRLEEATAYFTTIQKAYEVLSDPQERAWYDRNRVAILGMARQRRKQTAGNAPTIDDLMAYFSASAYRGYDDGPKGFYTVYRRLFEVLEEFESDHQEELDMDDYDEDLHTSFGTADTPFEPLLGRFYEKWLNFASARPFHEVQAYDTEYADNRRVRRAIEKENERKREAARREFSDTVRSLAAFLKKRDPRWKAYAYEKQVEKDRAERVRKVQSKATRRADIDGFVEPDWARKDLDDLESAAKEFFPRSPSEHEAGETEPDDDDDDDDDDDAAGDGLDFNEFYCAPCKKLFKAQTQWKNHEQSKKHKDTLRKMGIRTHRVFYGEEASGDDQPADAALDKPAAASDDTGPVSELEPELESDSEPASESNSNFESESESKSESEPMPELYACGSEPVFGSAAEPVSPAALESLLERIRLEEGGRRKDRPDARSGPPVPKKKKKQGPVSSAQADDSHRCTVCRQVFASRNQLFRHVDAEGHAQAPRDAKSGRK